MLSGKYLASKRYSDSKKNLTAFGSEVNPSFLGLFFRTFTAPSAHRGVGGFERVSPFLA